MTYQLPMASVCFSTVTDSRRIVKELECSASDYSSKNPNLFNVKSMTECVVWIPSGFPAGNCVLHGTSYCDRKDRDDRRKGHRIALKDALQGIKEKLLRKQIWDSYLEAEKGKKN